MNCHYDQDQARVVLSSNTARATQDDPALPPLLSEIDIENYSVTTFDQPASHRLTHKEDPDSEAYFRIMGVVCSKVLPPILHKPRIKTTEHLRNLRQFVRVTGLGAPCFEDIHGAHEGVVSRFAEALGHERLTGIDQKFYEGDKAIDCHARYFTHREAVPHEKHLPFDQVVDPNNVLEELRGTTLIHGSDNKVEYLRRTVEGNGVISYSPLDPSIVKEGDIVEVTVAFVSVPIKAGQYRFLTALRAVALVCSEIRELSTMQRASMPGPMVLEPRAKRVFKRRMLYGGNDRQEDGKRVRND